MSFAAINLEKRYAGVRESLQSRPSYRWVVLATVTMASFMNNLTAGVVTVALPPMSAALNAGIEDVQLVVSLYLLATSSLLPVFGRLGDSVGRKRIFTTGFLLYTAGSAACGLGLNLPMVLGFRLLQAIGGSMLVANTMAITTIAFPPEERGRALGILASVVAAGALAGPPVGGLIVGLAGWRAVFFVNLPIGVFGYIFGQMILPVDPVSKEKERFDYLGAVLLAAMVLALLTVVSRALEWGWSSPKLWAAAAGGLVALVLLIIRETRTPHPMLDLGLFRIPLFTMGNLSGSVSYLVLSGNSILMSFYLQRMMGYSPYQAGLLLLPTPLVTALVAPFSGWLSDRIGYVIPTTAGMALTGTSLYLLSRLGAGSSYVEVAAKLILLGVGTAVFNSPNNSSVLGSVPRNKLGLTGGMMSSIRNIGMMTGTAVAASLFAAWAGPAGATTSGAVDKVAFLTGFSKSYHFLTFLAGLAMATCLVRASKVPRRPPGAWPAGSRR